MSYVLHSTEVQLRTMKVMVPPISMYHLRMLVALKNEGVNLDTPDAEGITKIIDLLADVIRENHPDLTAEQLFKEIDSYNLPLILQAIQMLPKNSTAPTGMTMTTQDVGQETIQTEN